MPGRVTTEIVPNVDGSVGVYGNGVEYARFDGANKTIDVLSGGTLDQNSGALHVRPSQERLVGTRAKVGTTAGWTVGAANNLPYMGTVAASQTAATLVVPIDGLKVGDTITGFKVVGQIESAGNTVTIDANLRAITAVAGEPTDTSVKSITQVSVTADTILNDSATASYAVVATQTPYLLITGTTGASTDVILMGATVTVTEA